MVPALTVMTICIKGELGDAVFGLIMNDPRFDNMPLILETPEESLWPEEITYSLFTPEITEVHPQQTA